LDADERGKEWLKELNDFYEDENFDHTPEGWIARMNKVDDEPEEDTMKRWLDFKHSIGIKEGQEFDQKIKDLFFEVSRYRKGKAEPVIEGMELEVLKVDAHNVIELDIARDVIRDVIYEALGKTIVPFKSYPLADENASWKEDNITYKTEWFAYHNYNTGTRKFPHHTPIDGEVKTVWRGVAKAMVDLFKDDSLSDEERKEVYEHLAKHYKEFDKEPPEFKDYSDEELTEISEKIVINFSDDDTDKIIKETIRLLKDEEPKE